MSKRDEFYPLLVACLVLVIVLMGAVMVRSGGEVPAADLPAEPSHGVEEDEPMQSQRPEPSDRLPLLTGPGEGERSAPEILSHGDYVAHGFGEVDGVTVLNCLEGFEEMYARGIRVFEADLRLTADLQVVLRHDWRSGWQEGIGEDAVPTLEEFLAAPVLGKYTPLSFRDLLLLMAAYPDICVITDTKYTDAELVAIQFSAMVEEAKALGGEYLFDRMVIQIYDRVMFRAVESVRPFPHYIYTLYSEGFDCTEETFREKAAFCAENGMLGLTMWASWWDPAYGAIGEELGLSVWVHTVNDGEEAAALLASGVAGVYTDRLAPDS